MQTTGKPEDKQVHIYSSYFILNFKKSYQVPSTQIVTYMRYQDAKRAKRYRFETSGPNKQQIQKKMQSACPKTLLFSISSRIIGFYLVEPAASTGYPLLPFVTNAGNHSRYIQQRITIIINLSQPQTTSATTNK